MRQSSNNKVQLKGLNPFADYSDLLVNGQAAPLGFTVDAKSSNALEKQNNLPATLLGLLVSGDGSVTQAWIEENFEKLQSFIRYLNNDMQFRLLGFIPSKLLLALLLEEESAVRKRHFEWCIKHPSSRTTQKTVHIQESINDWLDEYHRRLAIYGTEQSPNSPSTPADTTINNNLPEQSKA